MLNNTGRERVHVNNAVKKPSVNPSEIMTVC